MFQKCPICNGYGDMSCSSCERKICHCCKGSGIIDTITGLPPHKPVSEINDNFTNKSIYTHNVDDYPERSR